MGEEAVLADSGWAGEKSGLFEHPQAILAPAPLTKPPVHNLSEATQFSVLTSSQYPEWYQGNDFEQWLGFLRDQLLIREDGRRTGSQSEVENF